MTAMTQRLAAAVVAVFIATTSLTAVVTVPSDEASPAIAALATPERA